MNAMLIKAETLKSIYQKTDKDSVFTEMENLYLQTQDLEYIQMPKSMYLDWRMTLLKEKDKYLNKGLIDIQDKK